VAFAPAPDFGAALHGFLADPTGASHDRLWEQCTLDLDRVRGPMGERWQWFKAYNLDTSRTPSVQAALGALMGAFGMPAIPPEELEGIEAPTSLIWGRRDIATPLADAEAASERHGWPLQVIEDCGGDPPIERPEAFGKALRAVLGAPERASR
jgi:pimeloyl-ACP methyl ester carboxylesterase